MSVETARKPFGAVSEIIYYGYDGLPRQVALCPLCGSEDSHITEVFSRLGTDIDGVPYPGTIAKPPYAREGDGPPALVLAFAGACGHHWDFVIQQSGGQNYISTTSIENLRAMPYQDYLQTIHWKGMRLKALVRADYRCQLCRTHGPGGKGLNVHHNTYERRGAEEPEDLIVLCHSCHARHHEKLP